MLNSGGGGTVLECEKEVKLLGVTIDFMLDFIIHIINMCRKAARQLNVLKRIGYHLNRLKQNDNLLFFHNVKL